MVLFCHLFIKSYGMGLEGAGYTVTINSILMFVAINVYMFQVEEIKPAVKYPDSRMFKDIY